MAADFRKSSAAGQHTADMSSVASSSMIHMVAAIDGSKST